MLSAMQWELLHTTPITNAEQLRALLTARLNGNTEDFFSPVHPKDLTSLETGIDPLELEKAKHIIEKAITEQQKVVIFGDYDCDGVTATAVLWEALRSQGLIARPFLPHREKHGYGLSIHALEEVCAEEVPDLIITVDNGIVANGAFDWLRERGISTILTDHHLSHGKKPQVDALIHSTLLSGSTVSWILAHAIAPEGSSLLLDLAVLGMVADQVPMVGPGRSFAVHGMKALRMTDRPSLLKLAEISRVDLSQAEVSTIHFSLAPRINAMGRIRHALDSLRALLSRNPVRIHELMTDLQEVNNERQQLTEAAYVQLMQEKDQHNSEGIALVVGDFAEGIIGLLASKLLELTGKPSIVGTTRGEKLKFSCRSVAGIDITAFLRSVEGLEFAALGGHAMAAGFSLYKNDWEKQRQVLLQAARERVLPNLRPPILSLFASLDVSIIDLDLVQMLQHFAPFGPGNEEPTFLLNNLTIQNVQPLGKEGKHHKLSLQDERSQKVLTAVVFQTEKRIEGTLEGEMSFAVKLERSHYKGKQRLEILVQQAKAGTDWA